MTSHESSCQLLVAQCSTCRKTDSEANEKKKENNKTQNPVCHVYPPVSVWRGRGLDFVFSQGNLLQNEFQYFTGSYYGIYKVGMLDLGSKE